jgi:hypothetical protein
MAYNQNDGRVAYAAAVNALKRAHADEFAELVRRERVRRGLPAETLKAAMTAWKASA